jgi:hypothetical protein
MTVIRVAQEVVEVLATGTPKVRLAQEVVEVLARYTPKLVLAQPVIEVLMSTTAAAEDELTIACQANIAVLDGFLYQLTKSIDATASLALSDILAKYDTLTIDGTCDFSISEFVAQPGDLTLGSIADIALAGDLSLQNEITLSATGAFDSPGGVVYDIQRSIEGISDIDVLDGFSYEESIQLDGEGEVTVDYVYIMEHSISLDAISDITLLDVYEANVLFSIDGTAALALTTDGVWYESIGVNGTCTIFIENIFDFLLDVVSFASVSVSVVKIAPGEQNPSATGSFSAEAQCVFNRPITQTLVLVQTIVLKKPTQIMSQSLSLTQTVVCSKVHTDSVTHTLMLTQEAVAARAILQPLVLSDVALVTKVMFETVTHTFVPTDAATRTTVINRDVEDTLTYNPPNLQRLPIHGSNSQTGNHQFEYYVPNVSPVLVPRNCLIILGVPGQTVILPCPIWGDSQAYQGTIDLKRAMTGTTYTYVKKTQTQKLNYSFELWTFKMLELRSFFIEHSEEVMTLQNHNAETWLVHLVNNPLEFTTEERWQPKGEKYTVTLEFEGVKTGG